MYNMSPFADGGARVERVAPSLSAALPFLRRVYGYLFGGVLLAVAGAGVALYAGSPVEVAPGVALPPIVAFGVQHWIVMLIAYMGAFFAASFARRVPGVNALALFGYTFVTGLFLAPTLFFAQLMASHGQTLSASPVRDAFLLTGAAFTGLSGYTLVSRRDFSFLGAALSMGIWVILGAMLLGIFLQSAVLQLAIASVGVILFSGYILFDTSRLLHDPDETDAVGAALRLFLNIVNLFLFLLRIMSSQRER
jgi:modulator of FtsH protease